MGRHCQKESDGFIVYLVGSACPAMSETVCSLGSMMAIELHGLMETRCHTRNTLCRKVYPIGACPMCGNPRYERHLRIRADVESVKD